MSNPEGKGPTTYADDRPPYEPMGGSDLDPGLGRRGRLIESERAATGEPTDESIEMPVVDQNPFRP